jgi:hypothetical protein
LIWSYFAIVKPLFELDELDGDEELVGDEEPVGVPEVFETFGVGLGEFFDCSANSLNF